MTEDIEKDIKKEKSCSMAQSGSIEQNCGKAEKQQENQEACCRHKRVPRQEKELKQLKNRLNRIAGQLNGIGRMLDENRYCGDILTQVAAVESALQAFGYVVLKEHMETCMVEELRRDNIEIIEEAVELIKKLK